MQFQLCGGISAAEAEVPAQGTIDQVDGLLRFHAGSEELLQWDEQIRSICGQLNGILDRAAAKGLKLVEA